MGKVRNLRTEKRVSIVALHDAGLSNRDIARRLQCHHTTVARTLERFQQRGDYKDRPRSGAPRVTTARDDRFIAQVARRQRFCTAPSLMSHWRPTLNRNVSISTLRRRLVFSQNISKLIIFDTVFKHFKLE